MKLCFIADATTVHTKRWVEYFSSTGHEVHLITYEPPEEPMEGVHLHVIASMFKNLYLAFPFRHLKIMRLVKMIKPDIVHAHFITKFGFHGALLGFHPLVMSAWGSDVLVIPNNSKLLWYFTRFSLRRADMIHAVSEYMANEIISNFGISENKIKILPFGIDSKRFNPDVDAPEIRDLLGRHDAPIVMSVRNFEPIYDIECLINAIPLVIKKTPSAKFVFLGKGTLKNTLKDMVKELGVSNNVEFIGHVPHDELQKYLSCADVYVSTSLSDSLGVSNLEAMACGVPAILTDIPINKELIKKGLNIDLFPLKESKTLAEKIVESMESSNVYDREKNHILIEKQYDWDLNIGEMDELYLKLIDGYEQKIPRD